MLARMPIRVEGFIEAPLQGGSYGKRAMITADRKRAADLGQGRASRLSVCRLEILQQSARRFLPA
ncbi:hypothetical protein PsSCT_37560 [Pseudomonas sp. SCT]